MQETEQPEVVDSEDRIASLFGGPEPEESQDTETASQTEEPVEETFELEYEGEKFVLPKKLEKAILQERDYTQKSQMLAEQRRALEHAQQQLQLAQAEREFTQAISEEQQQIQMIDALLQQKTQLNWGTMSTDEILRARAEIDQLKEHRASLEKSVGQKQQQFILQQQQQLQQLRAQALEMVARKIPGWNEELAKEVRQHALSEGYTEAELSSVYDPRHVLTLWKAAQYDKMRAQAKPAVSQAKPVRTGSSKPMTPETKQYLNFRKTIQSAKPGSPQYRQALEDRIASKFGG